MGDKRKNTADGKTPPSKAPTLPALAVEAPAWMGLPELKPKVEGGLPGLKPPTHPSPSPAPAPAPAPNDEKPPPPASSVITAYCQAEDKRGLLDLARGVVALPAVEKEVVRLLDSEVPKTVLRCDECHGSLKPPVYQCSQMRHLACSDCGAGGECGACCEALAEVAVYIQNSRLSSLLGYFKVPCLYNKYGCESSFVYGEVAAHAASCAHAPCLCRECSVEGSPSDLVRHLTDKAGPHGWTATNITYGTGLPFPITVEEDDAFDSRRFLFVAVEDGGVFLLALSCKHGMYAVNVVCVRGNAGTTGPMYSSSVAVEGPLADGIRHQVETEAMASCPVPVEFDTGLLFRCLLVYPEMRRGDEIHLSMCIRKKRI